MKEVVLDLSMHPRQLEAYYTQGTELLFGGASEGGKSAFLRRALCRWCIEIPNLSCTLIRKKFDDIILNHVEGDDGFRVLLAPLIALKMVSVTENGVKFWNGSHIAFKHCQDERQFSSAQGVGTHVLAIDEATQISPRMIKAFRGWVRMSEEMQATLPPQYKGMFPRIIYTANPIGPSLGYFRREFVKARPQRAMQEVDGFIRQYIPSRIADNPSANATAQRGRLAAFDAATATALIEGDWDAPLGDMFPEWDERRHVIPDSPIPSHWYRFRTYDWGTADPAVCYFWAVSPGETLRGKYIPRGALVCYREWYICADDDPSKGRRMRNEDMASGILSRTEPEFQRQPTLTDKYPFVDGGGETIANVFMRNGVVLTLGDCSRVPGWSQLRSRLIGIEIDSNSPIRHPMIYFMESCIYAREYLPALPRHPSEEKKREDAAEHGEATHASDAIRLACMAFTVIKDATIPMQERIEQEYKTKPTIQKILRINGDGYFN